MLEGIGVSVKGGVGKRCCCCGCCCCWAEEQKFSGDDRQSMGFWRTVVAGWWWSLLLPFENVEFEGEATGGETLWCRAASMGLLA